MTEQTANYRDIQKSDPATILDADNLVDKDLSDDDFASFLSERKGEANSAENSEPREPSELESFVKSDDEEPDVHAGDLFSDEDDSNDETNHEEPDSSEDDADNSDLITLKVNGADVQVSQEKVEEYARKYLATEQRLEGVKQLEKELREKTEKEVSEKTQKWEQSRRVYQGMLKHLESGHPADVNDVWEGLRKGNPNIPPLEVVVQNYVRDQLNWAGMTEEQREAELAKRKVQRYEAQLNAQKQQQEHAKKQEEDIYRRKQMVQQVQTQYPAAIEKVGLKADTQERRVKLYTAMTNKILNAQTQGKQISVEQAAQDVKEDMIAAFKMVMEDSSETQTAELLKPYFKKADQGRIHNMRTKHSHTPARRNKSRQSVEKVVSLEDWDPLND